MCGRLFIKPVTELEKLLEMFGILGITLTLFNNDDVVFLDAVGNE